MEKVHKVFPHIQTLRVDINTINKVKYIPNFDNIDIVTDTIFPQLENYPIGIRSKCHSTYCIDEINDTTRKVYLKSYTIQQIRYIKNFNTIKHLYLTRKHLPTHAEVKELNECSKKMKITIIATKQLVKNQSFKKRQILSENTQIAYVDHDLLCVIPSSGDIDFCINPFNSIGNMISFEKYYLPLKLVLIEQSINDFIDLTTFQYTKEIIIYSSRGAALKKYIKLPVSINKLIVHSKPLRHRRIPEDHLEITNWKDLNNLREIDDHNELGIPYPQIKKRIFPKKKINEIDKFFFFFNALCIIYTFSSTIIHFNTIIQSKFDVNVIYHSVFQQFFWFVNIESILTIVGICSAPELKKILVLLIAFMMWYPYSLLFYQSNWYLYFITFLTYPYALVNINFILSDCKISLYVVNAYLNMIFHGYWISSSKEKQLAYRLTVLSDIIIGWAIVLFLCSMFIGLIISFFNLYGILKIISLISLIGVMLGITTYNW
ncbi:hypothetical protein QTN25_002193 [Entamoeba marina]